MLCFFAGFGRFDVAFGQILLNLYRMCCFFCGFGRFDVAFGVSTGSYPFDLQLLLRFDVPEDGFPSIEDWNHTFTSILLGGLELQREPLDVSISDFKPDGASAASNDCQSLVNVCV